MKRIGLLLIIFSLLVTSCGKKYTEEQKAYIASIEKMRQEKDNEFETSEESPFNHKSKVHFEPLKYYDADPAWVFKSKLTQYEKKDTITVFGTKGEERKAVRYGYVTFRHDNKDYKLNVYKGFSGDTEYYSIWFTDQTTGEETYGVGRYLDFELNPDSNYVYTIDFNQAYNPYCAYNPSYTCAVPTKEDHLNMAIESGEKRWH